MSTNSTAAPARRSHAKRRSSRLSFSMWKVDAKRPIVLLRWLERFVAEGGGRHQQPVPVLHVGEADRPGKLRHQRPFKEGPDHHHVPSDARIVGEIRLQIAVAVE